MKRLRLYDCRNSRLPSVVGACQDNIPKIAQYVNTAQRRLLYAREAGEEGWWGTWAEIRFNVSRAQPYITLPRDVARLQAINVCDSYAPIQNQLFEYLTFGNGRMPKTYLACGGPLQAYTRNNAVTTTNLTDAPQYLTAFLTDAADNGKRVLIGGLDANGNTITSLDGQVHVQGIFLSLAAPFVVSPITFNEITGIQKDVTAGRVLIYQQDPATAAQTLLLTMEPGETTASYRRYYFDSLPLNCQNGSGASTSVTVTALAKMDLVPVVADTDYCLIQNLEAIIEECQSVRYSEVDNMASKQMAQERHIQAIRLLIGELAHFLGKETPAVSVKPFGSARLENRKIGVML